jgi:hypothetical protein
VIPSVRVAAAARDQGLQQFLLLLREFEEEGRPRPVAGKPEASTARSRPQLDSEKLSTGAELVRSEPKTSPSSTAREDEELEEEKC